MATDTDTVMDMDTVTGIGRGRMAITTGIGISLMSPGIGTDMVGTTTIIGDVSGPTGCAAR